MDPRSIRILFIEDNEGDAEDLVLELEQAGFVLSWKRVSTDVELDQALLEPWDVAICDYVIPGMRWDRSRAAVLAALKIVPFIVVSGQRGEEYAVETIRGGADDYILKSRLMRLAPAIERELAFADTARKLLKDRKEATEARAMAELRLATVEQDERRRIARAIHDGALQTFVAVSYQLSAVVNGADPVAIAAKLERAALEGISLLRGTLEDLVPPKVTDGDVVGALWVVVDRFRVADTPHVSIVDSTTTPLSDAIAMTIFQIGREAIANAILHAEASTISVTLSQIEDSFVLRVFDDGKGFDHARAESKDGHLGLSSMSDRSLEAGGTFDLAHVVPHGTSVVASVPLVRPAGR